MQDTKIPNHMTTACVFPAGSRELRLSAEKVSEDSLPSAVSPAVPYLKPSNGTRRVLLLASESIFESEAKTASQNQQRVGESSVFFDLVYVDPYTH